MDRSHSYGRQPDLCGSRFYYISAGISSVACPSAYREAEAYVKQAVGMTDVAAQPNLEDDFCTSEHAAFLQRPQVQDGSDPRQGTCHSHQRQLRALDIEETKQGLT